ncbi:MAG: hypothetical protein WCA28_18785 [Bradyrhizobium sp.]
MKDESSRDACRNGNDATPPAVRKNAKGKHHQDGQYRNLDEGQSHEPTLPCETFSNEYAPRAAHFPARDQATIKLTKWPSIEFLPPSPRMNKGQTQPLPRAAHPQCPPHRM